MRKHLALAFVVLACCAADAAAAVDIKNVRATFGPFGAPRTSNQLLPGDVYMLYFDITGLSISPKNGAVQYIITLDVFDPKGKQIIPDKDRTAKKPVVIGLGGDTVPEVTTVVLGLDQVQGKYKVVVTVEDPAAKSSKQLVQQLELLPPEFGLIHIMAPAVGFVGQDYVAEFSIVGMARDPKKVPKITIKSRVLDSAGKPTTQEPNISKVPEDMPQEIQWDRQELVRMQSPILLNRPGRFTVEIEVTDELSKKTKKFSYTLNVLEVSGK